MDDTVDMEPLLLASAPLESERLSLTWPADDCESEHTNEASEFATEALVSVKHLFGCRKVYKLQAD